MNIKVVRTFEGIVAREFHPSGEHAYRLHANGAWHHCLDHKGPWLVVPYHDVLARFRDAIEREALNK
jgi:hypothetical protein